MLNELVREHRCTTVIVSHDPESARIADRIVRIRDGRVSEEWARDSEQSDTIVVGRGGWLRLPEELLLRAGIGTKATARFERGSVLVEPAGTPVETPEPGSDGARRHGEQDSRASGPVVASARGLTRSYGSTTALRNVSLELNGGRLHAVIGPSGSGKTTLLHLLAGLEVPDEGTIAVDGVDMAALDRTARSALRREKIAYVAQQAGLVPHLSALENVELVLAPRARRRWPGGLASPKSVGLVVPGRPRVARLSQGNVRVAIARAIAAGPILLLADEPTSRLGQRDLGRGAASRRRGFRAWPRSRRSR